MRWRVGDGQACKARCAEEVERQRHEGHDQCADQHEALGQPYLAALRGEVGAAVPPKELRVLQDLRVEPVPGPVLVDKDVVAVHAEDDYELHAEDANDHEYYRGREEIAAHACDVRPGGHGVQGQAEH